MDKITSNQTNEQIDAKVERNDGRDLLKNKVGEQSLISKSWSDNF